MYRITGSDREGIAKFVKRAEDPYVVDIRPSGEKRLKKYFGRDYVHIVELTNRGMTEVILKAEITGMMRLRKILDRARDFQREVIILHDDSDHYSYVRRLIDESANK